MRSVRIYILTTTGASRIVYLDREDAESGVQSAIRVDGETRPLPISQGYGDFIDTFVQRLSGHRIYRADVMHRIDGGESWQLGFLTAHWVLENPSLTLAMEEQPYDLALFVTGRLRDRPAAGRIDVRPVHGLGEKLRAARDEMLGYIGRQEDAYLVVPRGNLSEVEAFEAANPPLVKISEFRVSSFDEVTGKLGGRDKGAKTPPGVSRGYGRRALRTALVLGLAAVCGLAAFYLWSEDPKPVPVNPPPGKAVDVTFDFYTLGPEDRKDCSGNRFRNSKEVLTPVPLQEDKAIVLTNGASICAFALLLENRAAASLTVYSYLYRDSAGAAAPAGFSPAKSQSDQVAAGNKAELMFELPRFRTSRESWTLVAFAVPGGDMPPPKVPESVIAVQDAARAAADDGAATFERQIVLKE